MGACTSWRRLHTCSYRDWNQIEARNYTLGAYQEILGMYSGSCHDRLVALLDDAWPAYQGQVDRVFGTTPRSRFVKDLRNYMLYRTLPVSAGSFGYEKDGPFTHTITLLVRRGSLQARSQRDRR